MLTEHATEIASIKQIVSHIDSKLDDMGKMFNKFFDDHESRIRELEKDKAARVELTKIHSRIDTIAEKINKTWLYLAIAAGASGGGSAFISKLFF